MIKRIGIIFIIIANNNSNSINIRMKECVTIIIMGFIVSKNSLDRYRLPLAGWGR
jgi:hypothetical protein